MSLEVLVAEVARLLEASGIPFFIGGSVASSTWGQVRATMDCDIVVHMNRDQFENLSLRIDWPLTIDRNNIRDNLDHPRPFAAGQILHGETLDRVDLFLMAGTEYDLAALENRRWVSMGDGASLPFASPEDTVIAKLRWFELGNRVSDRQWNDLVNVLDVQAGNLDLPYMRKWATVFGLLDLLEEALSQVTPDSP